MCLGTVMQELAADADYQRIYAEITKAFELHDRMVSVIEDL